MQKKFFLYLFIICVSFQGIAQKTLEKEFDIFGVDLIEIDGTGVFNVRITTSPDAQHLQLKVSAEGETYENIATTVKYYGSRLELGVEYAPYFEPVNDKLAAHKVVAIEMEVVIPEYKELIMRSDIGSFYGEGNYKRLAVSLEGGSIFLNGFIGNAELNTKEGAIAVISSVDARGRASSRYGQVENQLVGEGAYLIEATSVKGSITLKRTQ